MNTPTATSPAKTTPCSSFKSLKSGDVAAALADGLIGKDAAIDGPFGAKPLVYADYVASGRALMQVERFILEQVLPYYANSHTEASYCGGFITRLRREARATIARCCGADEAHAVIFAGSGATAGINRLVHLFGVRAALAAGRQVRVIIGPYEHHSNILPWRECGADVIEWGKPRRRTGPGRIGRRLASAGRHARHLRAVGGLERDRHRRGRPGHHAAGQAVWRENAVGLRRRRAVPVHPDVARRRCADRRHRFLAAQVHRRSRRLGRADCPARRRDRDDAGLAGRRHCQVRVAGRPRLQRQPGIARRGGHPGTSWAISAPRWSCW